MSLSFKGDDGDAMVLCSDKTTYEVKVRRPLHSWARLTTGCQLLAKARALPTTAFQPYQG